MIIFKVHLLWRMLRQRCDDSNQGRRIMFYPCFPLPFPFHSFNWDEPVFCTGQETGPRTGNGKAISSILFLFFGNWRTGFTGHTTSADERSGQLIMVSFVSKWIGGLAVTGRWDILFCPLWCAGVSRRPVANLTYGNYPILSCRRSQVQP